MRIRWLITVVVAAALVVIPLVISIRPPAESALGAPELAAKIRSAAGLSWSGQVQSSGGLRLPADATLAGLGQLFGGDHDLRVWWRGPEAWRIDRLRSTGEVDLYRQRGYTIRWEFETQSAVSAPVSQIRLPDVSDLVPASLASFVLAGTEDVELSRQPARRIAGLDAAGLRISPRDPAAGVERVDLWADPTSGLPLRVEVSGFGDSRPALTTTVTDFRLGPVDDAVLVFSPPAGSTFRYDQSVDVAAAANALVPYDMPARLAGLESRTGAHPDAAGAYGRGPTLLIALPLRGDVAGPLRAQFRAGGAQRTTLGWLAPAGPMAILVTSGRLDPAGRGGSFLLVGTVTTATLQRAAGELLGRR